MSKIEGLGGIEVKGRSLVIGAMTPHAEVATSPLVQQTIPALAALAGRIGDPAVRHRGTIGGSVANNDPNADYRRLPWLGATIVTNKRRIKADDFFKGLFETALESDEIITKVMFPAPKKAAYVKFQSGVALCAGGRVRVKRGADIRVAVTGAGAKGVFAWPRSRTRSRSASARNPWTGFGPGEGMGSDIHGSAEYRAHLVGVLARRAVAAAGGRLRRWPGMFIVCHGRTCSGHLRLSFLPAKARRGWPGQARP